MRSRHAVRGVQAGFAVLIAAISLLSVTLLDQPTAEASTLGATPWQVHVNDTVYLNPYAGSLHGHPVEFNAAPPIPAAGDASWAACGPGAPSRWSPYSGWFSMCPSATNIGLQGGSILPGCWVNLNFTYFQSLVTIPSGTTVSTFTVDMSGADDGAQIVLFNSQYPGGVVPPGGNIYQGTPQSTANLAPYVVQGDNRVVIQQVDDCAVGNNLQSATITLNGTTVPPLPPDTTPPVVTPTIIGTLGNDGWYRSNVTVSWTVIDPDSPIITSFGCFPSNVITDTSHATFTCTAASQGGSASQTVTLKRDATPPSMFSNRTPVANGNGWNNSDVNVSFSGFDTLSGLAGCSPLATVGEGVNQSATGICTDRAGNITSLTVSNINVDKTAPSISVAPTTPPNANGWHNTAVTMRFTCTDSGSGVAACPADEVISTEGNTFLSGRTVTDRAGNSAQSGAAVVRIDRTAPTASATRSPEANAAGWNNTDVTVSFSGSDGVSGIDFCSAPVVLGEGVGQSATGTCTDRAGNVSAPAGVTDINVDKTRPVIVATALAAPGASGWYTGPVVIRYTCTDAGGSGFAPDACPADEAISADGTWSSSVHTVTDLAGNESDPSNTVTVQIDQTAPVASATRSPEANAAGWNNTAVTVTFSGTDEGSGIASCSAPAVFGEGAGQSATGTCTDVAGNVSEPVSVTDISVDLSAPVITVTVSASPDASGWYTAPVTVQFTCSDTGGSGLVPGSCPADLLVDTDGTTTIPSYLVTDLAGNVSAATEVIVLHVDQVAPSATATASPAPNGDGWNNTEVTVTFSGTDATSGVASCDAPVTLGEGAGQSASGTCTDVAGNESDAVTASDINVDLTAPEVTLTGAVDGATYTAGAAPTPVCTSVDTLSGIATAATLTVSGSLGTVTATCAGVTDRAGNAGPVVSVTYTVAYDFCGFAQPLLVPVQQFKSGSTIPVKFCLRDAFGAPVTTATGVVEAYVNGVLQGTEAIRYTGGQYIANVQTKSGRTNWPTGTLELRVVLNDGSTHSTNVLSTDGVKGGLALR